MLFLEVDASSVKMPLRWVVFVSVAQVLPAMCVRFCSVLCLQLLLASCLVTPNAAGSVGVGSVVFVVILQEQQRYSWIILICKAYGFMLRRVHTR